MAFGSWSNESSLAWFRRSLANWRKNPVLTWCVIALSIFILFSVDFRMTVSVYARGPELKHIRAETQRELTVTLGDLNAGLPLHRGTFLYLGTVAALARPPAALLERACMPRSTLVVLSKLRLRLSEAGACKPTSTVYAPNATWVGARNKLLHEGYIIEAKQGWRFEFFVFVDGDAEITRSASAGKDATVKSGSETFQEALLRDRPLRASISAGVIPIAPLAHDGVECGRACFMDATLDAYHRTGITWFLPHDAAVDNLSPYAANFVTSLLVSALAPEHCSIYKQLTLTDASVLQSLHQHGTELEQDRAHAIASQMLIRRRVPGFGPADKTRNKLNTGLFGGEPEKCPHHNATVDYAQILKLW